MDCNKYLLCTIKNRIKTNGKFPIFLSANSEGKVSALNNYAILKYIDKYTNELSKYAGKVCIIYHNFDEMLIGFIIAAFSCQLKILIRRTSIDSGNEINDDLLKLKKTLPIDLVYTKNGIQIIKDCESIVQINTSDFDFIQLSSGTTADSKAYCLSIEGLIRSAQHIKIVQHVNKDSIFLSYLTLSHIYGFVSGFILPIISGAKGIFCKTSYIKENPDILFKIITIEKVTHTSAIISSIIQGIENKTKDWDLSSLICVSLGGEKINIETFKKLLNGMTCLGMNKMALVNSYGMSEKGSVSMEDPYIGNTFCENYGNTYVSVGNNVFEDTEIIIVNDKLCRVTGNEIGLIGIDSPYMAVGYFKYNAFFKLEYITIEGKKYYCNGDMGFIKDNKVFITGRIVNTITYNGLKIAADTLNEAFIRMLKDYSIVVNRCFTFNYPKQNNYVVCYIDYPNTIQNSIIKFICKRIETTYHVLIKDVWVSNYESHGLNKISLPNIINKYEFYLKEQIDSEE